MKLFYIKAGSIKFQTPLENYLAVSEKIKCSLHHDSALPFLYLYAREMRAYAHTVLSVHSNFIHNSLKSETTQTPVNGRVGAWVWHIPWGSVVCSIYPSLFTSLPLVGVAHLLEDPMLVLVPSGNRKGELDTVYVWYQAQALQGYHILDAGSCYVQQSSDFVTAS